MSHCLADDSSYAVADPDLQIRGRGPGHPDPKIRVGGGGGGGVKKNFFRPLKTAGGGGGGGGGGAVLKKLFSALRIRGRGRSSRP